MVQNRVHRTVQTMAEVGIMAAVGFILDLIASVAFKGVFPNGGSISIAMICVLAMAFRRGPIAALGVGFIMGAFDLMKGPYAIASTPDRVVMQLILDYVIAYPMVATAAVVKPLFDRAETKAQALLWVIVGTLIGGTMKLLSHFLSGIFFWADPSGFAWELTWMNPYLYCFLYNFAFTGPSIVLSGLILGLAYWRAPHLLRTKKVERPEPVETKKSGPISVISLVTLVLATALFVTYLIRYIASYSVYDDGYGVDHSFDRTALSLAILGILWMILSGISLYNARKHYRWRVFPICLLTMGLTSLGGAISMIVRAGQKGEIEVTLWIWLAGAIAIIVGAIVYYLIRRFAHPAPKLEPVEEQGSKDY